jgi:hypothetical protein
MSVRAPKTEKCSEVLGWVFIYTQKLPNDGKTTKVSGQRNTCGTDQKDSNPP